MFYISIKKAKAKKEYRGILAKVNEICKPKFLHVKDDSLDFVFDKELSKKEVKAIEKLGDKKQSWWSRLFS